MRSLFQFFLWLGWVLMALAAVGQAADITEADRVAIRTIIERQLDAFRQDNAAAAFSFASPSIQAKFGTPEQFLQMVKTAYQPVYRPRRVVFQELRFMHGMPMQPVLIIDPEGIPVMAFYPMEKQPDGAWRIDGCYLRPFQRQQL